jgi:copper chaperone CopZ
MKIYVKNMACESCKAFVQQVMDELKIETVKVELGEIITKGDVTDEDKLVINSKIAEVGLELLEKKRSWGFVYANYGVQAIY